MPQVSQSAPQQKGSWCHWRRIYCGLLCIAESLTTTLLLTLVPATAPLRLLDMYVEVVGASTAVDTLLGVLRDRLAEELGLQQQLQQLAGALEPLLAAAALA